MKTNFPVGFHEFNKDEGLNFQLNRFYSSGVLGYDELMDIGGQVTNFESWIELFLGLAEEARQSNDMKKCAICYRAAQFYTLGNDRDNEGRLLKTVLYEKCFDAYEKVYAEIPNLHYERIPFQTGYLPAYYMKHVELSKGTIVMHGGYDSFVQEFLTYVFYLFEAGYDVYMFEGPGQGEVLYRCNIKMTPQWEHCVSTVLDYYKLDDVTLIGISLGGYLATRAAAYEKRVKRLVMFDLIYDFYGSLRARMGEKKGRIFDYLTLHPKNILWKPVNKRLENIYFTNWLLEQGYFIYEGIGTPCEYFNHIKQYNTRDISRLITQDTLVLAGEKDIYTVYLKDQIEALKNARTVESRLFTKAEHADHHCQIGNSKLVLDVIADWIERVS
ncbi:MAG TPA: alpha/beta hydrolase [Anaerovoracaceae bacterium]|nr:alpha/beta hydrolase [Anaerovoracaceae bacterium]